MIKLGWTRDIEKNTQEYYYDENLKRVYEVCLSSYNAGIPLQLSPSLAICIVGPLVTIMKKMFDLKQFNLSIYNFVLFILFIMLGCYYISKSFDKAEMRKFDYIKGNNIGTVADKGRVLQLYKIGRRYRYGLVGVVLLCIALLFFWIWVYSMEKNSTSILLIYVCSFCAFIMIKMLAPIKTYKIMKKVRGEII